jgi:DNA-binding transcriptional LysR family regulator
MCIIMTLLQLRYFTAVCKYHSVSKASEELFVSRTAISRSVHALEQEFGVVLFSHTTAGLDLTNEGRILYERVEEVLGHIRSIEQEAKKLAENANQQIVNVGLTPFTSQAFFPDFYQTFHKANPNIVLRVIEQDNLEARSSLINGMIDIIFTTDICYDSEYCGILPLGETEQILYVSCEHPLATRKKVGVEDICGLPLAMLCKNLQREHELTSRLEAMGHPPNIVMRLSQLSSIYRLVERNLACAVQIKGSFLPPNVVGIPFEPPLPVDVALIWNKRRAEDVAVRTVIEFAKSFYKKED